MGGQRAGTSFSPSQLFDSSNASVGPIGGPENSPLWAMTSCSNKAKTENNNSKEKKGNQFGVRTVGREKSKEKRRYPDIIEDKDF